MPRVTEYRHKEAFVGSEFLPKIALISSIEELTSKEKLFTIKLLSDEEFNYKPCQFVMVSILGFGEAPISICSGPNDKEIKLCIRKVGSLTKKIHSMKVGDRIGIRGPYGNGFDVENIINKDVLLIAGGLGLAPLRSLIRDILHDRDKCKKFTLFYGTKKQSDRLFVDDIEEWTNNKTMDFYETVDVGDSDWNGHIGLVTGLFKYIDINPDNTIAFVLGPQVMYRFILRELLLKEIKLGSIYMDFERRMKCAIQKCGHCQINGTFVCVDGPVFNYSDMIKMDMKEAL